jgi:carbonic anhydrase
VRDAVTDITIEELLVRNKAWAERVRRQEPDFFSRLVAQQAPRFLWIGCSDSRVPSTQIVDLDPGAVFVHRNVANLVVHTDINCLSVLQYAVDVLEVEHIIVCGHYGCGGIACATDSRQHGLIDNWLRHVKDIYDLHERQLRLIADPSRREARLVELNVLHQVYNVARTTIVQNAWSRGARLAIHGWVYRLEDGIVHDLGFHIGGPDEIGVVYRVVASDA